MPVDHIQAAVILHPVKYMPVEKRKLKNMLI